ncbi:MULTISPECIES: phospholipid carrier-dependent glycosyltransferase [unclassified Moorena]|uniref:glycosyltransferase family 39 protein n=1 Tax=unclassified Moorena TaxID=2683338 RepID=UPI0013CA3404|nr:MULTISPECIES: phospholipid carrier-dependent glycosyltransferase [unclassified Moorena]NEO19700.1 phospholipid carrier-dependent glycosyltransferase [Moorena sp. SIO4A5]NEQ58731.1 phospholipid carrier-dependent glycosyltransferase [Moorena sp. SIO4A1]
MKTFLRSLWFQPLLLLFWITIGSVLRFTNLTLKSPWTDEFATIVFSLGNSYQTLPLDQAISLSTLLQPLAFNPESGASAVIHHLFTEDHHPPLYFVLANWWMRLFSFGVQAFDGTSLQHSDLVIWGMRSLPALFGIVSIPVIYGLSWVGFRSRLVAQLAAAIMAVSPYGVFLAQEARHYTLAILWVMASLCCLVIAVQHLQRQTVLPIWISLSWVVVNCLGIATHYFFLLTLCAEAMVLLGLWGLAKLSPSRPYPIRRIGAVAVGSAMGGLVWLPVWLSSYDAQMTEWIISSTEGSWAWSKPIFQAFAAWITMLSLLPVESSSLIVVIASGLVMLVFLIWLLPILYRYLKIQLNHPQTGLVTGVLGSFLISAIALFFGITYCLGTDLTRGARYSFVYFPAVIVLVAAALAVSNPRASTTNSTDNSSPSRPKTIALVLIMGFLSSITVVSNLGYQKYYRPDLLVPIIEQQSSVPILIATTHNTLVQTGEMMGLAWEFQQKADQKLSSVNPQFILAHQDQIQCQQSNCPAALTLKQTVADLSSTLDLWLVNFNATVEELPNCSAENSVNNLISVDGYQAQVYHCLDPQLSAVSDQPSAYFIQ